ncbi:hypothetical protein HDU98_002766, partial [Podochytrium sp. JEL0797]
MDHVLALLATILEKQNQQQRQQEFLNARLSALEDLQSQASSTLSSINARLPVLIKRATETPSTNSQRQHILYKKFHPHLADIPPELVMRIFALVPPDEVFKFRRLARQFNTLLQNASFSSQLLAHFSPFNRPIEHYHCASGMDMMFFCAPIAYQTKYANSWMRGVTFIKVFDTENPVPSAHIPPAIGLCTSLEFLEMDNWKGPLSGCIPPQIGNLRALTHLRISRHNLTGHIPLSLFGLSGLKTLDLSENRLNGPIPPDIGQLVNLWDLDFSFNALSDSIPDEVGNLVRLRKLNLQSNELTGCAPSKLGTLPELHELDLSFNWLNTPMPDEIFGMGL